MLRRVLFLAFIVVMACAVYGQIVVNEIMYNSPSYDKEWVELYNITDSDIYLDSTYILTDGEGEYQFEGITIASGEYLTIYVYSYGSDTTALYFTPDVDARGNGIQLNNDSDQVVIRDVAADITIDSVQYYDDWAPASDGNGYTLSRRDPYGESNDPANWGASADSLGTPGEINNVVKIAEKKSLPIDFNISAYPNPFNSSVSINVSSDANVEIYNLQGEKVSQILGNNSIWHPENGLETGIYLVRATTKDGRTATKKIVYMR